VALWDVTHRHEPPPDDLEARLAGRQLHRAVELDAHGGTPMVRFHDADVRLDLGSIAKGYGVDRAAYAIRRSGVRSALVNVGGDLYALGTAPGGDPWRVGIQDPNDDRALVGTVDVSDAAVATSGTYLQFFRYRGARFHHLIDPATGESGGDGLLAVTVACGDPAWAEIHCKRLYLAGGRRIADEARAAGLAAWWVDTEGRLSMTPAARQRSTWVAG
jgi:thiamine biosynthesis lipoprotein